MTEALTAAAFRGRLLREAVRENKPIACVYEITPRCNLRCGFCFVALDPYVGPYLDTPRAKEAIDRLADAGILFMTFTGGEICSRRDFPEIYRHAIDRGMLVTLFTNGTMISPRIVEVLREKPPFSVEVSIYGADAEHYERVTGIPGSFAKFQAGISALQGLGIQPLLKHPVTELTVDHLDAIRQWCIERGLPIKMTTDIENRHDGGDAPALYRLSSRRANAVKDEAHELRYGRPRELPAAECAPMEGGGADRLYYCAAGRGVVFLDANGQLSHCVWDREPSFPLLDMSWAEIQAGMLAWVNQPLPEEAPCHGCGMRTGCNNCPARSRLTTGSPFLRDMRQCETTQQAYANVTRPPASVAERRRAPARCAS